MKVYRSNSLTIEEQDKLVSLTESFEDLALFKLVLNTGIRREDIVGIELSNVFLDERKITFWENKKRRFWNVPLSVDVTNELRRYINTLPKGQRKLFTFTGRTAYNKLQHYLKKAGITKPLAFHDLRRTYMKTAKKRGIPSKVVSQVTGDKVSTIEEFYENFTHEELLEEIDKPK
jgi:integrase